MTCRRPLEAAQHIAGGAPIVYKTGQRPKTLAEGYAALELPCGQCISCRLEYKRQWAIRMMHEAAYYEEAENKYSSMITLTYDEKNVPYGGTLVKHHLQDFIKRLRWHLGENRISHYSVGEYGTKCPDHDLKNCPICGPLQRPHYHGIIFGWEFPDKELKGHRDGNPVYQSNLLSKTWEFGSHEIGTCTFESCAYIADYIMKKQTGNDYEVADYYCRYIPNINAWIDLEPEFSLKSTNPAIGKRWLEMYHEDVYPTDEVPIPGRGIMGTPPKYYDKLHERKGGNLSEIKKKRRYEMAKSLAHGPSIRSRAKVQDAKLQLKTKRL